MFTLRLNGIMSTKSYAHEQSYCRVFVVSLFFLCIFPYNISILFKKSVKDYTIYGCYLHKYTKIKLLTFPTKINDTTLKVIVKVLQHFTFPDNNFCATYIQNYPLVLYTLVKFR